MILIYSSCTRYTYQTLSNAIVHTVKRMLITFKSKRSFTVLFAHIITDCCASNISTNDMIHVLFMNYLAVSYQLISLNYLSWRFGI